MTSYNGANTHNVESILASIRSTIGDEHDPRVATRGQARATAAAPQPQRQTAVAEEAAEFELPAIFKPGHAQSPSLGDARPNLFGRLSDALKPVAAAEVDRSRTVIRFEPAAAGRMIEPPAPLMAAARPEPHHEPKVTAENADAPRQMTSFFDSRMIGMSSTSQPERRPEPAPAPYVPAAAPPPLPPVLDRADAQAAGGGMMEDAAAQMLRPILRQWLTENMPKIVEKALQIESNGELPRSPSDHHAPPRKTLR